MLKVVEVREETRDMSWDEVDEVKSWRRLKAEDWRLKLVTKRNAESIKNNMPHVPFF